MAYKREIDYQRLIDESVARGSFGAAARYERARNEKIDGEGLSYEKTHRYTAYLDGDGAGTARPGYTSAYRGQIAAVNGALQSRPAFVYDPERDDDYLAYKEQYARAGAAAMRDTLGTVAARTGGMAGSYAGTAAQQEYDRYMAALADKAPALRAQKYREYRDEEDALRARLAALRALEGDDYGKYTDALGQYNTDRSFAYKRDRDAAEDARVADETAYKRRRDADETAYDRARDAASDARYADKTAYDRAQAARKEAKTQTAAKTAKTGRAAQADDADVQGEAAVEALYRAMRRSADPYTYLLLAGYTGTAAKSIAEGGYARWLARQTPGGMGR